MARLAKVEYTADARHDMKRCRQFLRRRSPGNVTRRIRGVMSAIRTVSATPKINPVRKVAPETGLHLRRHNIAQFAIVYAYFEPGASEPRGLLSIRAIRHAGEDDVFWGVREAGVEDASGNMPPPLSTGHGVASL